jgi:hypothetical protein
MVAGDLFCMDYFGIELWLAAKRNAFGTQGIGSIWVSIREEILLYAVAIIFG